MRCADALVRLLHLNAPASSLKSGGDDEAYKVLVLDRVTKDIVAPLLRINDLRKCVPCLNRLVLDAVLCMQDWLCSVVPRGGPSHSAPLPGMAGQWSSLQLAVFRA